MAHALKSYDGPCRNIHGHSYELCVTIKGKPMHQSENPKIGMVMDFGDLKTLINKIIIEPFDHALVLCSAFPKETTDFLKQNFNKVIVLDYQPTSELMLIDFAKRIQSGLPENVTLHHVLLRETASSFAEWYAEDNI